MAETQPKPADRSDDEPKPSMYVGMLHGPTSYYRDAGIPFHVAVRDQLVDLRIVEETTEAVTNAYRDLPSFPADRGPTASAEMSDIALGVGLYLAGAIGNGVVGQLVDDAYGRAVRPALGRFWERLISHRQRSITIVFDHWYDATGVLLRVEFVSRAPDEEVPDLVKVFEAKALAAAYIEENGLTHRVMSYRVVDGELDATPRLAEPIT